MSSLAQSKAAIAAAKKIHEDLVDIYVSYVLDFFDENVAYVPDLIINDKENKVQIRTLHFFALKSLLSSSNLRLSLVFASHAHG